MKKKQEELIRTLYEHSDKLTSTALSKTLSISIRTVKSYIAELNFTYPGLILSSNRGYTIHKKKANMLLQHKDDLPQDYEGRCIYLIKKVLLEKQTNLDLFDLCEELFISYSTLKNDIYKMNTSFANFQLTFSCIDQKLQISGTEKNKRKLISHVMSEEASGNFLDLSFLQESFPDYDIEQACYLIKDIFQKHQYYMNDFSFINLILHVTIMISRMHHGNHVLEHEPPTSFEELKESQMMEELCVALQDIFHVSFTLSEKFEIYILFNANIHSHQKDQKTDLTKVIPEDILALAKHLIKSVDQHYFVNLDSENFVTPFALHLKNLKNRLENHSSIKNPMLESIKISCPTIYDISTFLAYQLTQFFHETISEDEIGFLALHVGTEIERQKTVEAKVSCVLLCPEYLNIGTLLYNKILMDFGEQISIQKLVSFERELENETFDLLITTLPLSDCDKYLSVVLPPLPMHYDKNKIMEAITRIENTKKSQILADNIDFYFSEDLFYLKNYQTNKEEIINELADQMISLGYVHHNFKAEVWKREDASSTAFMNIAIPHPMKMSAFKTSIAIVISPKGIEWTKQHFVNVVFMIAFNKIDNKHFHRLYESLILLFNEPEVMREIKKCKNFEDFKQIIIRNYIKYT